MKVVKSAYRALDALERLAASPDGLTFTELMTQMRLAKSTAHELLHTLHSRKYVQYHPNKKTYTVGSKVLRLGVQYLQHSPEIEKAVNWFRPLVSNYRGTMRLGVRSGEHIMIILEESEAPSMKSHRSVGTEIPLFSTSMGRAMLCRSSEAEIQQAWQSSQHAAERSSVGHQAFLWELQEVRNFGFSLEVQGKEDKDFTMSIPIYNDANDITLALSISFEKGAETYSRFKEIGFAVFDLCRKMNPAFFNENADIEGKGIYVSLPNFSSQKALEYLQTFDHELQASSMTWLPTHAHDNEWKQQLCLELVLDRLRPAGVVICPVNAVTADPLFRAASWAGVPAICFQRPCRSRFVDYFVGSDGYEQGMMQMEYVAKRLKGRGRVLLLEGDPYNDNARSMSIGHEAVLKNYTNMTLVASIPVLLWSKEESRQIIAETIAAGKPFDAVIAGCDQMAEGVIEELQQHKMAGKVIVVGADGDMSAVQLIKLRKQHATVFQWPKEAAKAAIGAAVALSKGVSINEFERRRLWGDFPGKELQVLAIPSTFYDASNIAELENYWKTAAVWMEIS